MMNGEDIDVIFYFLFDSLRCLKDEIKEKNQLDIEEIENME